jgi:thiamine-monophosphate kinase
MGIGDDAAVLQALAPYAVVSADMLVESVDFEWAWASPKDVGHKAAAVNLSDLAAMGATPRGLLASLALQPKMRVADVLDLLASLHRLGERFGAPLVGGDISRTQGPCVIAVTALGQVAKNRSLPRHAGRVGDVIAVTGTLGAAAAGLCQLQTGMALTKSLVRRQLRPMPQLALGKALAKAQVVRAAADISDGLIKDVAHVLRPKAGAILDVHALPIARGVLRVAQSQGLQSWQMALSGGEDFELVLAIPKARWARAKAIAQRHNVPLTAVGRVTAQSGIRVTGAVGARLPVGFDHFSAA